MSNPGKDGASPRASARARTPRLPDAKLVAHVQENPDFAKAYQATAKQQQGKRRGKTFPTRSPSVPAWMCCRFFTAAGGGRKYG